MFGVEPAVEMIVILDRTPKAEGRRERTSDSRSPDLDAPPPSTGGREDDTKRAREVRARCLLEHRNERGRWEKENRKSEEASMECGGWREKTAKEGREGVRKREKWWVILKERTRATKNLQGGYSAELPRWKSDRC